MGAEKNNLSGAVCAAANHHHTYAQQSSPPRRQQTAGQNPGQPNTGRYSNDTRNTSQK